MSQMSDEEDDWKPDIKAPSRPHLSRALHTVRPA